MSKEVIEWLGPCPSDENCANTTEHDFAEKNRAECKRFKELLEKAYPAPGEFCGFKVQVETGHDFGIYREVAIWQDEAISDEDQIKVNNWRIQVQEAPYTWSELEEIVKAKVPFFINTLPNKE